jgi:hypothetical protein
MTTDLRAQVAAYTSRYVDEIPPVDVEAIVSQPITERRAKPRRRAMPAWAYAIVAAVVVLLVVGGGALIFGIAGENPPVVTSPDITVTTVTPPPSDPTEGLPAPSDTRADQLSFASWTWTRHDTGASLIEATYPMPEPEVFRTPQAPVPEIDGLDWFVSTDTSQFAAVGDTTVAAVQAYGSVDWESVFGETVQPTWNWESRTLDIWSGVTGESIALLDLSAQAGSPAAVEFTDSETGEVVFRLEASDPGVPLEALAGDFPLDYWQPQAWLLHVSDEGWITPPWQGLPVENVELRATDTGFLAVATVRPPWDDPDRNSLLYTWDSPDGVTWRHMSGPTSLGTRVGTFALAADEDRMMLLAVGPRGAIVGSGGRTEHNPSTLWTSVDGSDWQLADADLGIGGVWFTNATFTRDPRGWIMARSAIDGRCEVWVSSDGVTWEMVPFQPDISTPPNDESLTTYTACFTTAGAVVARVDDTVDGIVWVGRFTE